MHRRSFLFTSLLLAASAASAGNPFSGAKPPEAASAYASENLSAQGSFRVSYRTEGAVPIGRLHSWTLHVARADGTPVADARIAVDGDMPQHLHGLPTRPRVTRYLGDGDYLLEGVKFQMGGWWVMDFDITTGGRTERVRFHLQLKR
ncbi:MAG TPA: FixH family protein [Ramlibacter sp.]|jgi:hypothetical protein|nr:FixH family protein [Ramlibacter sp.]